MWDVSNTSLGRKVGGALNGISNGGRPSVNSLNFDPHATIARGTATIKRTLGDGSIADVDIAIEFDFQSGSIEIDGVEVAGLPIDEVEAAADILKRVIEGDIGAALELIPNPGGLVRRKISSNYATIRDRYYEDHGGPQNVFFASESFVRWASYGTLAEWILQAIGESPAVAFAQAMQEVKSKSIEELRPLARWLRGRVTGDVTDAAQRVLLGEPVDWPDVSFMWERVTYESQLYIANNLVADNVFPNPHLAFAFVWKGAGGSIQPQTRPHNIESSPIVLVEEDPNVIVLRSLVCHDQQGRLFPDRAELRICVDGRSSSCLRRRMVTGSEWTINHTVEYYDSVRIELWDIDIAFPDFLGYVHFEPNQLSGACSFTANEHASYELFWSRG